MMTASEQTASNFRSELIYAPPLIEADQMPNARDLACSNNLTTKMHGHHKNNLAQTNIQGSQT
jgi:hypothetical protein